MRLSETVGAELADMEASRIPARGLLVDHFPVHLGLRFSRNDVMPSRKSAVVRLCAFCAMESANWRSRSCAMKLLIRALVARMDAGLFPCSDAASSRARGMSCA